MESLQTASVSGRSGRCAASALAPTGSSDRSSFRPQMKTAEVENARAGILSQKLRPSSLEHDGDVTAASAATLMANFTACVHVPNGGRVTKRWPREGGNW